MQQKGYCQMDDPYTEEPVIRLPGPENDQELQRNHDQTKQTVYLGQNGEYLDPVVGQLHPFLGFGGQKIVR